MKFLKKYRIGWRLRCGHLCLTAILFIIGSIFEEGAAQTSQLPGCVSAPSGLVSWWPGEGNANDIQGSNHGTLQNGAAFAAGMVGQAISFDGVDDFIRIEDNSNLRLGIGEITIDAWVMASPSNTFRAIAAKVGLSFPFPGYALRIADDNKVELIATDCGTGSCGFSLPGGGGSRQPVRSTSVVADNTFHHVTGVRRSDGTLEIYVDGVLENTRLEPLRNTDSADPFTIGEIDAVGPEQTFNGLIDEVSIYNRALSAQEIAGIYNAGSAGKCQTPPVCVDPPSGLISWWPSDENANDIQDSNHGTLQNGATFTTGLVDQAFSFDGVNDYVLIPHNANLDPGAGSFTLTAWVKTTSTANQTLVSKYECGGSCPPGGANSLYFLSMLAGKVVAEIRDSDGSSPGELFLTGSNYIADGNFHHVAMLRDITTSQLRIYIDGELDASAALNAGSDGEIQDNDGEADPLLIGGFFNGGTITLRDPFTGLIDEVEYFNRALSASEIQAIFQAGSAGQCKGEPPVAICQNLTIAAGNNCQAVVLPEEVDNGSFDPDGSGITLSLDPPGPYPLGNTEVTLTVTDADGEFSACQATITVENNEPIADAVVIAAKSVWIKQGADILSGNVIVNDTIPGLPGPYLDSGVELAVGEDVTTAAGYSLKAHRIKVKQNAVVSSDVFFNELNNNGAVTGAQNSPLELPVSCSLPPFKSEPAGTQNITVNKNGSISLNNSVAYGDILVKQNGIILFTGGGTFKIRSLNTGIATKLLFDAPTEILIEEKFDTDQNSYVGPDVGAAIDGSDIIFYVAGINGSNGNLGATPKAAQVGLNNTVFANFYVPNGTLWLRENSDVSGGFIGKDVIVGINVQVNLDNAFGGSSLLKTAAFAGNNKDHGSTSASPEHFILEQNYPNPFNPVTHIRYALPEPAHVKIQVFNALGQQVATLVSEYKPAGYHVVDFDASHLTSGVYYYRISAGKFHAVKKMMLIK